MKRPNRLVAVPLALTLAVLAGCSTTPTGTAASTSTFGCTFS